MLCDTFDFFKSFHIQILPPGTVREVVMDLRLLMEPEAKLSLTLIFVFSITSMCSFHVGVWVGRGRENISKYALIQKQ